MALGVVGGMQEWSRGSLGECGDGLGWLWGGCGAWEWSWGALGAFGVALGWLWGQSVGFGAALGLLWGHRAGSGGGFGDMGKVWGLLGWLWGGFRVALGSCSVSVWKCRADEGIPRALGGNPGAPLGGCRVLGGCGSPPLKPPALFAGDRGERGADHGHPVQEVPGHVGRLAGAHLLPGDGPRHHAPLLQQHPDRHQQLAAHRGSVGHGAGGRGGVPAPFWGQNGVLGVWGTPQSCVSW